MQKRKAFLFSLILWLPLNALCKEWKPESFSLTLVDEINPIYNENFIISNDISKTSYNLSEDFNLFPEDVTDEAGNDWSFAGWYYEDGTAEEDFRDWERRENGYTLYARYNKVLGVSEIKDGDYLVLKNDAVKAVRMKYDYASYVEALVFGVFLSDGDKLRVMGFEVGKRIKWHYSIKINKEEMDLSPVDMAIDMSGADNYSIIETLTDAPAKFRAYLWAEGYGTRNSLLGGWESGWYLPSALEYRDFVFRNFERLMERLSHFGSDISSSETFWTSSVDESYLVWSPCYAGLLENNGEKKWDICFSKKADTYRSILVMHDYP